MSENDLTVGADAPREPVYLAFLSYKGGVGRTLAAASCANALARGGRRVLVVDFDIDAPSITSHYGIDSFADLGERTPDLPNAVMHGTGLVPWVVDRDERTLKPVRNLRQHLAPIATTEGGGTLDLLPAGPVGAKYLRQLSHMRWQAWVRPRETEKAWALQVIRDLRREIDSIGVDFVVIDTPAGIDTAAFRLMLHLADHAAFLVTNEPGERVVARDVRRHFKQGNFKVVLSRFPSQLRNPELLDLAGWEGFDRPEVLRHDPLFGLQVRSSVPLTGSFFDILGNEIDTPYQLTLDHLRLLDSLLKPKDHDEPSSEVRTTASPKFPGLDAVISDPTVREWLVKARAEVFEEHYKLFTHAGGTILNPSDPEFAANVSFRISSIRAMFNDVWQALGEGKGRDEAFESAGANAGWAYGRSLRQKIGLEGGIDKTLDRWCREDSQVGFGDLRKKNFDDETMEGRIQIANAFLPPQIGPAGPMRGGSSIFSGYVKGVLHGLLDPETPGHIGRFGGVAVEWLDVPDAEGRDTAIVRFGPSIEETPPFNPPAAAVD